MSKKDSKQSYSKQSILYIALMRHKKGLLLVILIAMISSSLAWFYKSLSAGIKIQGEVDSFNVSVGDSVIYDFGFDVLKPGVEQTPVHTPPEARQNVIQVKNGGTTDAFLSLEVRNIYLFGEKLVREGTTNEDGTPVTNAQYTVQMTRGEEITPDGKKIYTSVHYEILGFPWEVIIDFPNMILASGATSDLDFTLRWKFNGDTTQVPIDDTSGATQPECLSRIIDPNVLNYVSSQKASYKDIGINVDANDLLPMLSESEINDDSQYRITTCDIIDTYYGEQSVKFQEEKLPKNSIDIDELYYRRQTDSEDVKRPKKDLFIEMSLTVTQAGSHSIDIGDGGATESEPVTTT